MEFEPKNRKLVFKSSDNLHDKVAYVQNLCDKANEKINHFDRLRQQILNFAFLIFSALLAFIIKTNNSLIHLIACLGISGLMIAFRQLDQRYHIFTHGYEGSIYVFGQVIAHLLNGRTEDVEFYQYCREAEKTVGRRNLQTKIYFALAAVIAVLPLAIAITKHIPAYLMWVVLAGLTLSPFALFALIKFLATKRD